MRTLARRLVELALAAGIAVLAVSAVAHLAEHGLGLIRDLALETESGRVDPKRPDVESGARLRLRLTLRRPAALLVLLEDPKSDLWEVHPGHGSIETRPAGSLRLPPGEEAWETAGLAEHGEYMLLILASDEPETLEALRSAGNEKALEEELKRRKTWVDVQGCPLRLR